MSMERKTIFADKAPRPGGHYSHAVRAGSLLFVSGATPLDPTTRKLVDGDIGDHTRRCLLNLQAVCEAAGASLSNAVRCQIYVTDISNFAAVNEAYAAFFPDSPPARTTIGVSSLPVSANIEIDAIVAL
jgi:2-iminobutanoate/2-iminopropanoate deaminase